MAKIEHCPSCGGTEIKVAGNKVLCRACDVVYTIEDDGARVEDTDPLGKVKERLDNIEAKIAEPQKQQGDEPDPSSDDEPDESDETDEDERGFVSL